MVAGRGAKNARGVAQLGARRKVGVVPNAGAVDEPAQGVGSLVALETREHRRRHRQDEETGAQQIGRELDRRLCVRLGGEQVTAAHPDQRTKRRDGHDRQCRASDARPHEDVISALQGCVKAIGRPEGAQSQERPVLATVGLEGEPGRDRARCEIDRAGRRAQVHHLFHRERGQRRGLQNIARRAAWISQLGDHRIGLSSGRRRGRADAQQGNLELLACRLPRRKPLLSAAQNCRSFGGAAGEEEHSAELDCSLSDCHRLLDMLDDL